MVAGLQVNVLGTFEARDRGGQPLVVSARKSRALIAALALAPQSAMARESLASLLWSDRGEEQARSSIGVDDVRIGIDQNNARSRSVKRRFKRTCRGET